MSISGEEPGSLLNDLKPMLGVTGDIRTPHEVARIISLMKDAEKLFSRCIYINVLKATISQAQENLNSKETLDKFLSVGGWNILNKWLMEAKKGENFPVVIELLEVLKSLPVTIEFLKQGNTGKLVKHLTKLDNHEIRKMASDILKQWMSLVRQNQTPNADKIKLNGTSESVESSELSETSRDANKAGKIAISDGAKAGKRLRENSTELNKSPQPEKKTKTLNEVKSSISIKQVSKTKMIPPQPKPLAMESTGFMNALASATVATQPRKRKRTTATKASTTPSITTTTANSNASLSTKPTYTGILDEILSSQSQTHGSDDKEVEKDKSKEKENKESTNDKDKSSPTGSPQPAETTPSGDAGDFTNENENKAKDSPETTPPASVDSTQSKSNDETSVPSEQPVKKSKKGKKVKWAEDNKLTKIHYFDLDEEERTIRHPVNFVDAAHNEMVRERQLVEQAKRLSEDRMSEKVLWYRPKVIKVSHEQAEPGTKSEEYKIQKERESSILADLYLSKSSLPDSPAEPDPVINKGPEGEPKVIPHDEKGTIHLPAKTVAPQESQPAQSGRGVQLPPALASLFSSSSGASGSSPSTSAQSGSAAVTVDSLLDKLMKGSLSGQPSPLSKLLASTQQAAKQGPPLDNQGNNLPHPQAPMMDPMQNNMGGQLGPGHQPNVGLLGPGPGIGHRMMGPPGPGQFGPPGPNGPPMRPEQHPGFQGPGGPRQGPPLGPRFPVPEGMNPQPRVPMPHRMPVPIRGRGGPAGPRPLCPELHSQDFYSDESYDEGEYIEEEQAEGVPGGITPAPRGGRGARRGRGRGGIAPGPGQMMTFRGRGGGGPRGRGSPPVCRHFVSSRGCLRGDSCHFLHPRTNCPPPT